MRGNLLYYSIVVALAGFLFGLDTVVISGVDEQLQLFWNSSNLFHGFVAMSMATMRPSKDIPERSLLIED